MRFDGDNAEFIQGADGSPLRLFHGTTQDFTHFEFGKTTDVGIHFGCEEQANHFAKGGTNGRVFPVFIRSHNSIDIGGMDFGWRYPHGTIRSLENVLYGQGHLLSAEDVTALGCTPNMSVPQAFEEDVMLAEREGATLLETCKVINRKIEKLLRTKEIDCIYYTNWQEPNDGKGRKAYLVLFPWQIVSAIDREILGRDLQ